MSKNPSKDEHGFPIIQFIFALVSSSIPHLSRYKTKKLPQEIAKKIHKATQTN
jgi:O-antigen/teichoic acid export membrane protein